MELDVVVEKDVAGASGRVAVGQCGDLTEQATEHRMREELSRLVKVGDRIGA